jgi:hypothetical protein
MKNLDDILDEMLVDALMQLRKAAVMPSKMRRKSLVGFPGKAARFTRWDAGDDECVVAAVEEHSVEITDAENVPGLILGNMMAEKVDTDAIKLFDGFSKCMGETSQALTMDTIFEAVQYLRNANAPGPYYGVFHPKQIWGPKGFSGLLNAPRGRDDVESGELSKLAGVEVDWATSTLTQDGQALSAIFSPAAMGLVDKGFFNTEANRDGAKINMYVCGLWKSVMIMDSWGVLIKSDISE